MVGRTAEHTIQRGAPFNFVRCEWGRHEVVSEPPTEGTLIVVGRAREEDRLRCERNLLVVFHSEGHSGVVGIVKPLVPAIP